MENSNTLKQEEKRKQAAKAVLVTFPLAKQNDYTIFNVIDEHGNLKYDGNVMGLNYDIKDSCSCPSFVNNNNSKTEGLYSDTHGFSFQCKHIIAAREEAKRILDQLENFNTESTPESVIDDSINKYSQEADGFINEKVDTTFYESKMIQKDLLL